MRLLTWDSHDELCLTRPLSGLQIPPYAILSHTWSVNSDEEVKLADIQQGRARAKAGYRKLEFCSDQAKRDQIKHFWVDTCCIDQTNGVELSEAINSMYRWYSGAEKCYVYLSDVPSSQSANAGNESPPWKSSLRRSRWFTRGWTLQELLAPKVVEFFSCDGVFLGTKRTLAEQIHEITTIPLAALYGTPPAQFSIAERWRWSQGRQTTREEDKAYCLFGIFDVFMPLIYGERDHAFLRLEEKVAERLGASASVSGGFDLVANLSASQSRPASTHSLYVDAEYRERAPKRRRVGQAELGDTQDHEPSMRDGRGDDECNYDNLRKSLAFDRIDFGIVKVKKALLSTCQWLFSHAHFRTWYESGGADHSTGFLWIKGKPGCGKSTLMKAAVEWTRRQTGKKRDRDTIVPYFFNARASASLEKSSLGLYRTVVHHLLSSNSSLRTLFADRFAYKDPGSLGEHWTEEELQEFLHEAVESNAPFKLCLFIDALDEAEYEDDVRQMISFLVQLSDRAILAGGPCRLQICLSSRHYPHISVGRGLSLVVEDQPEHSEDIEAYIAKQLTCSDGSEKDDLRTEILKKSAHIFLWVVLVVEMLNKLDDRRVDLVDMRARLDSIPAGLNELFKDILTKSDHGIETSVLFFQWMMFRMRPLEPAELFVAMEYSRSPHDATRILPAEISVPSSDRLARIILNCSRGLVEVVELPHPQAAVIQFIHETVREFLLKENGLASIIPALAANLAGISHEILRIACVRCIRTTQMPTDYEQHCEGSHRNKVSLATFRSRVHLELPFLDYAITHLFDHAEQAQKHNVSQQAFLLRQIDMHGKWLDMYRRWWNVFERYKTKKLKSSTNLSCLLAERGYSALLPVLLGISATSNTIQEPYPELLEIASRHGDEKMVQVLLDQGADVNARDSAGTTALMHASQKDSLTIVQMLLDAGAHINAQSESVGSALQVAVSFDDVEKIVPILLARGADVNVQGGKYGNALQAACVCWGDPVDRVKMLLDAGADVNAYGGEYGTALQAASSYDHKETVQLLLNAGADINADGGKYGNALQAACENLRYSVDLIKMLLDAGADVNAYGGEYGTALQAASRTGRKKRVELLLNAGADINASSGPYGTALQAASSYGHEETVQLLLDAGADINADGGNYGTALQAASARGYRQVAQILLDAEAKAKVRDSTAATTIHRAD